LHKKTAGSVAEVHTLGVFCRPIGDCVLCPAAIVATAIMVAGVGDLVWLRAFGGAVTVDGRVRQALAGRNSEMSVK